MATYMAILVLKPDCCPFQTSLMAEGVLYLHAGLYIVCHGVLSACWSVKISIGRGCVTVYSLHVGL